MDYLNSKCIEKGICRDVNCPEAVKCSSYKDTFGRWFITMGHAGFNSHSNNRNGYETKAKACGAMKRYLKLRNSLKRII
jgi:hypothetical protein